MPRDQRLYMTFPIDFDEHPKVEGLSDAAFRAFVSMNGYSRRHDLDGRIPAATARRRWKVRALNELVASHAERPLVFLDGDDYVIRDYAEHQLTSSDIEQLREKRAAAGRKGGKARANAEANSKQLLEQMDSKVQAESESESDDLTNTSTDQSLDNRASVATDSIIGKLAKQAGLDLYRIITRAAELGIEVDEAQAFQFGQEILAKAKIYPDHPTAYVMKTFTDSQFEVQKRLWEIAS